jgi:hypothetical protein
MIRINYLKEIQQNKFELVYEFVNNTKNKVEYCQKLIKDNNDLEVDEVKIIDVRINYIIYVFKIFLENK